MPSAYALTASNPIPADPYLTIDEYKQAPTGVNTDSLVPGDEAATLAELANAILRASSWVDSICGQVLAATPDVEAGRLSMARDGTLKIHPRFTPVLEVTGISYGTEPGELSTMTDLSTLWVEPAQIIVPVVGVGSLTSFSGPLGFSSAPYGSPMYATWSYIAGWPNTLLTATANAGDTSITVGSDVGFIPGSTMLTIYDGSQTEAVTVAGTYIPGSTPVTLTGPLRFAHAQVGVSVSALPPAVKQAAILLTSALIQTRGAVAVIAPSVGGLTAKYTESGTAKANRNRQTGNSDVEMAIDLLAPYRRVR
jgi:hypothetical protein